MKQCMELLRSDLADIVAVADGCEGGGIGCWSCRQAGHNGVGAAY
jgi:hypothetical protein